MGLEEDVIKIGKKLEKKISNDECDSALDVLERLKETKMTLEVLQVGDLIFELVLFPEVDVGM